MWLNGSSPLQKFQIIISDFPNNEFQETRNCKFQETDYHAFYLHIFK